MFKGLAERLKSELMKLAPEGTEINVISSPKLKYGSWYGAAIILSEYWKADWWITRQDYEEHGVSIIKRKALIYQ